jgi:probable rRNA maturation factor
VRPSRRFDLTVQYGCDRQVAPTRAELRRWARAALPGAGQVTIRLVDEEEGRALNHQYRGKDYATNVLSFAYGEMPVVHGDLVLCLPVALREAASQRKTPAAHLAHLVVHGMLHLQGFDHEDDDDALRMEEREREVLAALGLPDPYATP